MRERFVIGIFAILLLFVFPFAPLNAQEADQSKTDAAPVEFVVEIPEDASIEDLIKIQQEASRTFLTKLRGVNELEVQKPLYREMARVNFAVADKIIAAEPTSQQFNQACMYKMSGFQYGNIADPGKFDPNEIKTFVMEIKTKGASEQVLTLMNNFYYTMRTTALLQDDELNKEKIEAFKKELKELLASNPSAQSVSQLTRFILPCATLGGKIGDPELAANTRKEFFEVLKANGLEFTMLLEDFNKSEKKTLAGFNELMDSYKRLLAKDPSAASGRMASTLIAQAPLVAEESGDLEFVAKTGEKLIALLNDSGEPALVTVAKMMEGEVRRAQLVGKEFSMEGILLDGTKFDWSKYKGKAVLIDFWATWCGPCKAEVPQMKELYEKYHDKGFEIIGINVWERGKPATEILEYLEKEEVPWPHIDEKQSDDAGLENLAQMYGISGIPTLFLIGKDGKVISTTVRGIAIKNAVDKIFAE